MMQGAQNWKLSNCSDAYEPLFSDTAKRPLSKVYQKLGLARDSVISPITPLILGGIKTCEIRPISTAVAFELLSFRYEAIFHEFETFAECCDD